MQALVLTQDVHATYTSMVLSAGEKVALANEGRPIRTVLRWQLYATAASMLIAGFWIGFHGALSALAGGLINVVAGAVFGCIATHSKKRTAGEVLLALYRAEAGKVGLIVSCCGSR